MVNVCKNCQYPTDNNYCPNCGQKTSVHRFTVITMLHDFSHGFLHLESGLLFTMKQLALRPGTMLKNYLHGHRVRYINPFTYILLVAGVSAIMLAAFNWRSFFVDVGVFSPSSINEEFWESSIHHFSIRLLLAIPFYSLISWLFYYKKSYNYSEHVVANTFLRAQVGVVMLLVAPIADISGYAAATKIVFLFLVMGYMAWAYTGLFENRISFWGLLKAFVCVLITVTLELFFLGLLIKK